MILVLLQYQSLGLSLSLGGSVRLPLRRARTLSHNAARSNPQQGEDKTPVHLVTTVRIHRKLPAISSDVESLSLLLRGENFEGPRACRILRT
jgi:hypothetical protein